MPKVYTMPKLGHLMEEGTVAQWWKRPGDTVQRGDILLDIEIEKAVVQVESPFTGIIRRVLVENGEKAPVGAPLALYEEEDSH